MSAFINNFYGTYIEHIDTFVQHPDHAAQQPESVTEPLEQDIEPVDTSFFCTNQFTADIIEKNLRQAIEAASSKADACRRIMALETQGYILLSNVKDDRKAELINPFSMPKYNLHGDDFRKARNG